jgi:DNA-3-methyladenine glycosylase
MNLKIKSNTSAVLSSEYFQRDVLVVAPELIGKILKVQNELGCLTYRITETEAYRGEDDTACHASRGKTKRTAPMYESGGILYIYLIYGMYWMLNVVTGEKDNPQAVLIRGVEGYDGPGKLTKALGITGDDNRMKLNDKSRIQIFQDGFKPKIETLERIGIAYADKIDRERQWRFIMK